MQQTTLDIQDGRLKPFVSDYYLIDFISNEYTPTLLPPVGFPVLHFHYGRITEFYNRIEIPKDSIFIGQITRHVCIHPYSGVKILGINFKPYGFYNLFNISPSDFTDSGIDSRQILGAETVDLILEKIPSLNQSEKISYIESQLIRFIEKNQQKKYALYDDIVEQIISRNGLVNLEEMLSGKITMRTLERYFKKVIGISPKLFCQILRHKYVLQQIYSRPDLSWQDSILMGYYYDHSHFSRDFEKFSKMKPLDYLPLRNLFASKII